MSTDEQPARWPFVLRDPSFKQKIKNAKLLCVGAGGIGCELLKTLTLTGFENIEVIDLDTIDTSNLNRQFLFRKHHVGQAKSKVAAEVVQGFRPAAKIVSYQDNVRASKFDVNYFKQFDIVLNGLDNLEARMHVNRLCLAAEKPLIESGTTGYLGQVRVHLKGVTECYECRKKPVQKSYPICTIRNTPDKPIHCIVWAKDILFQRLFGKVEEASDLDEIVKEGEEGGAEAAAAAAAAAEQQKEEASAFIRQEGESSWKYAARIFDLVYRQQIQNVLKIDELWNTRPRPKMLHLEELVPDVEALSQGESGVSAARSLGLKTPQQVWTAQENARVFLRAIIMFLETRASELGSAMFDKDDPLAVDFVTAASNLRSECYGIPQQSAFDAKGMAGNIIHAIATTNAIVSGFMATEALKLLAGLSPACRDTYLRRNAVVFARRGVRKVELIACTKPDPPNPDCLVCGRSQLELRINTQTAKLGLLVDKVLKKQLAFTHPYIMLDSSVIYEEGDDLKEEDEDQWKAFQLSLTKTLQELPAGGIKHGSIVSVEDFLQDFKLELIITHQEDIDEEEHPEGFIIVGSASQKPQTTTAPSVPAPDAPSTSGATEPNAPSTTELTPAPTADSAAAKGKQPAIIVGGKRGLEEDGLEDQAVKRARLDSDAAIAAALAEEDVAGVIDLLSDDDDDPKATSTITTAGTDGAKPVAAVAAAAVDDDDDDVEVIELD